MQEIKQLSRSLNVTGNSAIKYGTSKYMTFYERFVPISLFCTITGNYFSL